MSLDHVFTTSIKTENALQMLPIAKIIFYQTIWMYNYVERNNPIFVFELCFKFSLFVWWYRNSIRLMLYIIAVTLNKSPFLQFAIQCIKWFVIWCILLVIISPVGCVFFYVCNVFIFVLLFRYYIQREIIEIYEIYIINIVIDSFD